MNVILYLTSRDYRVHKRAGKRLRELREMLAQGIGLVTIRNILRGIKGER